MSVKNVKARPFKDTSETDVTWVAQQLAKKLKEKILYNIENETSKLYNLYSSNSVNSCFLKQCNSFN